MLLVRISLISLLSVLAASAIAQFPLLDPEIHYEKQLYDSAHLVVEPFCPPTYPILGDSMDVTIKITNDGALPSAPDVLYFCQHVAFNFDWWNFDYLGQFQIPPLGVGDSIVLTERCSTGLFPGDYGADGEYFTTLQYIFDNYFFTFYGEEDRFKVNFSNVPGKLDYYCKKYNADLAINVSSQQLTYADDGLVAYHVAVKNNGPDKAYNFKAIIFDNAFDLFNIHDYFYEQYTGDFSFNPDIHELLSMAPHRLAQAWYIDSLAVGDSLEVDVTFKLPDYEGANLHPISIRIGTSVDSGHNLNQFYENDRDSIVLHYLPPNCGSIQGFSSLGIYGAHGYYLSDTMVNWQTADSLAEMDDGHLVSITSADENEFLKSMLGTQVALIGLNDADMEGVLQWTNSDSVIMDLSFDNSPENDFGTLVYWSGEWQMVNKWVEKPFILEKMCDLPVCPDDLFLATQADLDNFLAYYPDCEHINGDLTIGSSSKDITSIASLSNIKTVGSEMRIKKTQLKHLYGLGGLTDVGSTWVYRNDLLEDLQGLQNLEGVDRLYIQANPMLSSLAALGNLKSVKHLDLKRLKISDLNGLQNIMEIKSLYINENKYLKSLTGLDNLQKIDGYVHIGHNDALVSLQGLGSLTKVGLEMNLSGNKQLVSLEGLGFVDSLSLTLSGNGLKNLDGLEYAKYLESLQIYSSPFLTSLSALKQVQRIGRNLTIGNTSLMNLHGLDSLTYVGGTFYLQYNDNLINLDGLNHLDTIKGSLGIIRHDHLASMVSLENLKQIDGHLEISHNLSLTSLEGLQNIDPSSIRAGLSNQYDLRIFDNPLLSVCDIESICAFLGMGESSLVYDNGSGCNSEDEIDQECATMKPSAAPRFGTNKLSVYPNPATDKISVYSADFSNNLQEINVLDAYGRVFFVPKTSLGDSLITFDITLLPKGIYFIQGLSQKLRFVKI